LYPLLLLLLLDHHNCCINQGRSLLQIPGEAAAAAYAYNPVR
jgi:hypothetical protein